MYSNLYTAYKTLLNSNATKLPIDMFDFKVEGIEWLIVSLAEAEHKGILTGDLLEYAQAHDGCTIVFPSNYIVIVYKISLSRSERNFVLAHEVSHVVLRHVASGIKIGQSDLSTEISQEKEANDLAYLLLAPPCILADEGITDPDTISKMTGLPIEDAKRVMAELPGYGMARRLDIEDKLSEKFNTRRYRFRRTVKRLLGGAGVSVLAGVSCASTVLIERLEGGGSNA